MKLKVLRFSSQEDSTSGLLFLEQNNKLDFLCYTLEDEHRDNKVRGETRVPQGTYQIKLRQEGGFHEKYKKRFSFHKGMLHVVDVPNIEYILIHTGNTDEHTSGCLIVGETQQDLEVSKDGFIGSSTVAYKKMYSKVANQLLQGKKVTIEYTTIDKLLDKPAEKSDVYEKLQEISGEIKTLNAKLDGKNII